MAQTIQFKRGTGSTVLAAGEPGFNTTTKKLYVSDGAANYGVLMDALYDAYSIIYADTDNTPAALTVAASTFVGRKAADGIAAMTAAEAMAVLSGAAAAAFDLNSQKITSLADPTGAQDAASKAYVDSVAQGLNVHTAVGNATTANISLTGEQTIDGVLTSTSRILVKDQSDPTENGIYVTAAGAWARASDMDGDDEVAGSFVFVSAGTTLGSTGWVCTNEPESVEIGVDNITFAQFSDAGFITAGTGLTKTGNDIAISDTELLALAGLTFADDKIILGTGAGTVAMADCTVFAQSILDDADAAAVQTTLGLVIGTNVQAYDAELAALAGLTSAENKIPYFTGSGTAGLLDLATTVGDPGADTTLVSEQGIREALDALSAGTFVGLTDTPADFTDDALKILRVNSTPDAVEFVVFATEYLEGSPTEDLATKAPTSEWAFDHDAATTGVHGAGGNTLLHSASTIDGGTWT